MRKNQIRRVGVFCLLLSLNMSPTIAELAELRAREAIKIAEEAAAVPEPSSEAKKAWKTYKATEAEVEAAALRLREAVGQSATGVALAEAAGLRAREARKTEAKKAWEEYKAAEKERIAAAVEERIRHEIAGMKSQIAVQGAQIEVQDDQIAALQSQMTVILTQLSARS